ncbi:MAG: AAA family ATPase [Spirochaetia bacterium]|nr:AAA family ATPase [Spirochaetia bacterium]
MNFAELSQKAIELSKITNSVLIKEDKLPYDYDINKNSELKKTYEYIKQNVQAVFLTGGAGTGKSTFIKYLKNNLKKDTGKNCVVLAPTGVAATNIGGQTIHTFFNFGFGIVDAKKISEKKKNPVLDHTDLIIIDEISMVPAWLLDNIDYALRLWCDKTKPFGGKQILLIGDCFQLPPVVDEKDKEAKKFISQWDNSFFFAAKVFKTIDVQAVQLKKIYRQKDDEVFIHMLNRIRKCQNGYTHDLNFINEHCFIETRLGTKSIPEECLFLVTKNDDAEEFNRKKLNNLKQNNAKVEIFEGHEDGKFDFRHFLTPRNLELCIGAKVMVTKNIYTQNLVNGDMGKVVDFDDDYVDVEIKGSIFRLLRETWQSLRYLWDEESKTIKQIIIGTFSQIPLALGWAVTIHKSQGLTLDKVAIDADDAWASGQVYVALSRAKNLNGLLLCSRIPVSAVKSDQYIKLIYSELFPESDNEDLYNKNDNKKIVFDNNIFTINETEEITSVKIGGERINLYPRQGEKIGKHVRETLPRIIKYIPMQELHRLLTDKEYCYNTFSIRFEYPNGGIAKYTLLRLLEEGKYDEYGRPRYWVPKNYKYYICSQWYKDGASKYADWLIRLSRGELSNNLRKENNEALSAENLAKINAADEADIQRVGEANKTFHVVDPFGNIVSKGDINYQRKLDINIIINDDIEKNAENIAFLQKHNIPITLEARIIAKKIIDFETYKSVYLDKEKNTDSKTRQKIIREMIVNSPEWKNYK